MWALVFFSSLESLEKELSRSLLMNDFISFSFICGLLRSVAMGRPGLVAVLAGKRGWFLPCVLLPRKFVIILFFFSCVGTNDPPAAIMPWGLHYFVFCFFSCVGIEPPHRRKCRRV